jgi:hypothetical protein
MKSQHHRPQPPASLEDLRSRRTINVETEAMSHGYVTPSGRTRRTAFLRDLVTSLNLLPEGPEPGGSAPQRGRSLREGRRVHVVRGGQIVLSPIYAEGMGWEPGDELEVRREGNRLVLQKAR